MAVSESYLSTQLRNVLDDRRIAKDKTEVQVRLTNGTGMRGHFYLADGQRVADVLNDERQFIPFLDVGESIRLLNKALIIEVTPS